MMPLISISLVLIKTHNSKRYYWTTNISKPAKGIHWTTALTINLATYCNSSPPPSCQKISPFFSWQNHALKDASSITLTWPKAIPFYKYKLQWHGAAELSLGCLGGWATWQSVFQNVFGEIQNNWPSSAFSGRTIITKFHELVLIFWV